MRKIKKKPKDSYRHGNLKEALLNAALIFVRQHRRIDFSLREITKSLGVTPMAAYKHFASREGILAEVAVLGFTLLQRSFLETLERNPLDLQGLGKAYIHFARKHPEYFRVMFHPDLQASLDKSLILQPNAYDLLLQCIGQNQNASHYRKTSTESLAITAWSTVHGLASLLIDGNIESATDERTIERIIDDTTRHVIEGFH